jgi:hypothetical protein
MLFQPQVKRIWLIVYFEILAPVNSSIRPPVLAAEHVIDLAKIRKLPGVVIYKPDHQPSSNSHLPHCVCCHDPVPKSKVFKMIFQFHKFYSDGFCLGSSADPH